MCLYSRRQTLSLSSFDRLERSARTMYRSALHDQQQRGAQGSVTNSGLQKTHDNKMTAFEQWRYCDPGSLLCSSNTCAPQSAVAPGRVSF
jgi:hypothetical protein